MIAILLPVLVGFAGLVADSGIVYITKERLQNSVDAAALAGAQGLPDGGVATSIACEYIAANPVADMTGAHCTGAKADIETSSVSGGVLDTITVTARRQVTAVLMPIFGDFLPKTVEATATVTIGSLGGETCFFPLYIRDSDFEDDRALYTAIGFTYHSDAVLDEGANGNDDVTTAMADDCQDPDDSFEAAPGETLDLKQGSPTQQKKGWEDLEALATGAGSACPSPDIADYVVQDDDGNDMISPAIDLVNCPRLLLVPVVRPLNNDKDGEILGFTPFFFGGLCEDKSCSDPVTLDKHQAWGYYLTMEFTSDTSTHYDGYGTRVIVMSD